MGFMCCDVLYNYRGIVTKYHHAVSGFFMDQEELLFFTLMLVMWRAKRQHDLHPQLVAGRAPEVWTNRSHILIVFFRSEPDSVRSGNIMLNF